MKYLFIALCLFSNLAAEESMQPFEILRKFESFYNFIEPAIENTDEAFICYSGIPHPLFNVIMHLSCEKVEEKVDAIIENTPPEKPISFWVHPQNRAKGLTTVLIERGYSCCITCPLMAWQVMPMQKSSADIRQADMVVYNDIMAKVYQFEGAVREGFEKLMDRLKCENYVIYENNEPVGTGTLLVVGSAGGIFNDATLPERREASLEMMQFLMRRSSELGLKELIVMSSPEAQGIYGDLGFKNLFDIEVYAR